MKQLIFAFLFVTGLALIAPAYAQEKAAALDWVTVDLWPDYDRPSVLVLITGGLSADAPLPAEVTVPLPEGATVNVVARITDENEMIDDIEYVTEEGALTLVTPDARFRVEYYLPYEADGLQRAFTFAWLAQLSVEEMDVTVQQPQQATSLETEPEPSSVVEGGDGLQYYNLPGRSVAAGEPYLVAVTYTMGTPQLTQSSGATADPAQVEPDTTPVNWPVMLAIAGALLLLLALAWQLWGDRLTTARAGASRKPRPAHRSRRAANAVRYCHQCGEAAQPGDRFCRACGTRLKEAG
jgi:hypothetical protein